METPGVFTSMRHTTYITFLLFAFLALSCGKPDDNNTAKPNVGKNIPENKTGNKKRLSVEKQFSRLIFATIKNDRFDNYSKFFITASDLDYFFLMKLRNQQRLTKDPARIKKLKQSITTARAKFPARRKIHMRKLKDTFTWIRKQASVKGVNWKTAKYKGYQLENARHIHKVATADFILTFTDKNKHYVIKIPRCQYVRRGWVFSEPLRWEGLYK